MLLTHGHNDHVGDTEQIAKTTSWWCSGRTGLRTIPLPRPWAGRPLPWA
ncbi:hypothetical protein ACFTWQ_34485, partial [[Kitasatospora] papulosa]